MLNVLKGLANVRSWVVQFATGVKRNGCETNHGPLLRLSYHGATVHMRVVEAGDVLAAKGGARGLTVQACRPE